MAILKKIVHYFSYICYFLIILYVAVCIPNIFGYKPLVVLTGSMEPSFKPGSVIFYEKVEEKDIKEGDIITFKIDNDTLVSHRVNKITEDGLYETKGDCNNAPDSKLISYSNVVGKNTKVSIPYIGYYIRFVNDNLYLVMIVILILVSEFLLSNFGTFDIDKNKEKEK